ncbi:MAG: HAMP domain-containing histidine kinase [Bacteroidales bacterium]|nr:HAMP domain-containing histidine kinase [Bacteroidales bacterium]
MTGCADETQVIVKLTEIIDRVLAGKGAADIDIGDIHGLQSPELNALAEKVIMLNTQYLSSRSFILELARGVLDAEPPRRNFFADPYKQLHSELCHLTWQITQIADGDYDQKVYFLGDFAVAINKMIASLRERQQLSDKIIEDEKQLRQYSEELKASNATKDRLFSIISHDLRNPFNALVALSETMVNDLEAGDSEMAIDYARMMHDSVMQGYQLLVNLLDWSRQQSNKIVYTPRPFNPRNVINYIIGLVELSAASKHITVEFTAGSEYTIDSDETLFSTIVRNLISNALKYTPDGGHVSVEITRAAGSYNISVKDSGVGIAAHRQAMLFSADATVSTPGTNSETGTGLGLLLCKDFVRMLGGKIWVESEEGKGSTFTFSVPEKPATDEA